MLLNFSWEEVHDNMYQIIIPPVQKFRLDTSKVLRRSVPYAKVEFGDVWTVALLYHAPANPGISSQSAKLTSGLPDVHLLQVQANMLLHVLLSFCMGGALVRALGLPIQATVLRRLTICRVWHGNLMSIHSVLCTVPVPFPIDFGCPAHNAKRTSMPTY